MRSTRPGIPSGHGGRLCGPAVDTRRFVFRNCPTISFPIQSLWNSKRTRGAFFRTRSRYKGNRFQRLPDSKFSKPDRLEFQADTGGLFQDMG